MGAPDTGAVEGWFSGLAPELGQVAQALRKMLMEASPGHLKSSGESIKWGNPVYEAQGLVCYLAATDRYLSLGFYKATSLSGAAERMEGTGKAMRHVKFRSLEEASARAEECAAWVREAVALNQREGSAPSRKTGTA